MGVEPCRVSSFSNEAVNSLSDLRLGVDLDSHHIQATAIHELIVAIRPAHLQKEPGRRWMHFNVI